MITAIFIDDELLIRKQISSVFLWLDKEIELVGTFSSIEDAVEFLQERSVDIIITDICLKSGSGMNVAKYVYEHNLKTQVILLSAYKKFEYAKEGYKYGVASYITKPLDIEELKEVLQSLKKTIYANREAEAGKRDNAQYILDYFAEKESSFLCRLDLYIENRADYDNNFLYQCISNVFYMYKSSLTYVLTKLDAEKAVILIFPGREVSENAFKACVESECVALSQIFGETVLLQVEFRLSFLSVSGQLNFGNPSAETDSPVATYNDFLLKNLVEHLLTDEPEKAISVLRLIDGFFKTAQDKLVFANSLLKKMNIPVIIDELPEELDMARYLVEIIRKNNNKLLTTQTKMVGVILSYIEQNFHRDISLSDIADRMGMNPSYFSRYFKEIMGMNFSEYLVTFRINKAKAYLQESNMPIDVIANAVGYIHYQAFYKNFKKNVGMTPNDYRNSLKDKE